MFENAGRPFSVDTRVLLSDDQVKNTIEQIEQKWPDLTGSQMPLSYFFIDQEYDSLYKSEDRFGKLFLCIAILAIIISSLGLLGLSSFTIQRRMKEIGIRKVFGSSNLNIVVMLLKELLLLIWISFIIGVPIAWYSAVEWLSSFPYKISFSWWFFVITSLTVTALSVLTVGMQIIQAAIANPVKNLKAD